MKGMEGLDWDVYAVFKCECGYFQVHKMPVWQAIKDKVYNELTLKNLPYTYNEDEKLMSALATQLNVELINKLRHTIDEATKYISTLNQITTSL